MPQLSGNEPILGLNTFTEEVLENVGDMKLTHSLMDSQATTRLR
jgi:hypothetical protein